MVVAMLLTAALAGACTNDDDPGPGPDRHQVRPGPAHLHDLRPRGGGRRPSRRSSSASTTPTRASRSSCNAVEDEDAALKALRAGVNPDVFLLSRRDLAEVVRDKRNQPIDELLDSRGVDFGDYYKRDALQAFSLDDRLQCMPYGVSPMVIYYNTNLIDFETMREQGLPRPGVRRRAGPSTSSPRPPSTPPGGAPRACTSTPRLQGLAPFVYSGGGQLFDDMQEPTTLTLSDESSQRGARPPRCRCSAPTG